MKRLEERLRNFFPWSFALRFCTSFYRGVGPVSPPLESGTLRPVTCFDQQETVDVMLCAIRGWALRALAGLSSPCCGPGIMGRSSNSLLTDEDACEETYEGGCPRGTSPRRVSSNSPSTRNKTCPGSLKPLHLRWLVSEQVVTDIVDNEGLLVSRNPDFSCF